MAQEFTIKSQQIEDKINQLLPSQGGYQAGVDFSASTMVIPIVDLTETAEGSSLRQDLQTAQSLTSATAFSVGFNTTSTLINTTGYFSVKGFVENNGNSGCVIRLTDGTTTKNLYDIGATATGVVVVPVDIVVFLEAGDSLEVVTASATKFKGSTRQIADISGNLVNP